MIGFTDSGRHSGRRFGDIIAELMPNYAESFNVADGAKEDACTATLAFLHAAITACRSGVSRCHLVSYSKNGAMLQELFSRDGIGTQIVTEAAERLRAATITDIGGILDLIRPLEQQGSFGQSLA